MKKHFRRNLLAAGVLAALAGGLAQTAHAATGTTAMTMDFPNIVILYYPSQLDLVFSAPTGAGIDTVDVGAVNVSTNLGAAPTFNAAISATGGSLPTTTMTVTVDNVWAVRGISSTGTFDLSITLDTATNSAPAGSTVTLSNLQLKAGASTGANLTVPNLGFGTPMVGGIVFDADLTGLTQSGQHSGYQYTITAVAL